MKPPTQKEKRALKEPDLESLLLAILRDDRTGAKKLIGKDARLSTALVDQARLYESEIVHWLYANDTALHLAAAGCRVEIARMLLSGGGDANSARNHRQSRPLHYAADGGPSIDSAEQVKMIRCLLDAGADIHAADKNGATALHRAVRKRSVAAVELLLQAGSDPAAKNRPGATAFHLAVQNTGQSGSGDPVAKAAQRRIIEFMLAQKVSPTMKDARGKTVLDWATSEWVRQLLSDNARRRG